MDLLLAADIFHWNTLLSGNKNVACFWFSLTFLEWHTFCQYICVATSNSQTKRTTIMNESQKPKLVTVPCAQRTSRQARKTMADFIVVCVDRFWLTLQSLVWTPDGTQHTGFLSFIHWTTPRQGSFTFQYPFHFLRPFLFPPNKSVSQNQRHFLSTQFGSEICSGICSGIYTICLKWVRYSKWMCHDLIHPPFHQVKHSRCLVHYLFYTLSLARLVLFGNFRSLTVKL